MEDDVSPNTLRAFIVDREIYVVRYRDDEYNNESVYYLDRHLAVAHADFENKAYKETVYVDSHMARLAKVGDDYFLLTNKVERSYTDPETLRKQALAKLTPAERKILGV